MVGKATYSEGAMDLVKMCQDRPWCRGQDTKLNKDFLLI